MTCAGLTPFVALRARSIESYRFATYLDLAYGCPKQASLN